MLQEDEGYYFGLGAFETIAVEQGACVFRSTLCTFAPGNGIFSFVYRFCIDSEKGAESSCRKTDADREKGVKSSGFPEKHYSEYKRK